MTTPDCDDDVDIVASIEGLDLFDAVVGLWFPGMLSVFGIVGNALSLYVLSRDRVRSATLTSLKALAVSDLVLLVGALCQQIVPLSCEFAGSSRSWMCLRRGYIQVYAWPVICVAQMASVWLTVLISTERFLAVCAPLSSFARADRRAAAVDTVRSALVGPGRVRVAVSVIVIVSVLFNVPRFFEFQPTVVRLNDDQRYSTTLRQDDQTSGVMTSGVTTSGVTAISGVTMSGVTAISGVTTSGVMTSGVTASVIAVVVTASTNRTLNVSSQATMTSCNLRSTTPLLDSEYSEGEYMVVLGDTSLRRDEVYLYVYNTAFYCVVVYAAPLLVVCVFNVRLVMTLAHCRRVWNALNSNVKRELRATRLPIVIVLVFTVCGTVSLLGFILDAVFAASGGHQPRWLQVYFAVSNLLVILNSAVNFLLMLCFGNKFRRMLKSALRIVPPDVERRVALSTGRRVRAAPQTVALHHVAIDTRVAAVTSLCSCVAGYVALTEQRHGILIRTVSL